MGFLTSIGKMFNDYTGATASAQQQWKYQKEAAQNAHQWEVQDLEKAGLNPALSAGGSGNTGSSPGGGQSSVGITDIANSAATLFKTAKEMDVLQSQILNNDANSGLALANTGKVNAETRKIESETGGTVPALTNVVRGAGEQIGEWVGEKVQEAKKNSAKRERDYQKWRKEQKKIKEKTGSTSDLVSEMFN